MEHHRLKPMHDGYDVKLFDSIYKQTTALRKKLAYQIDSRKFGVDYQEILSWFDVKFIHSFNKFHRSFANKDIDNFEGKLMGYIINALSQYKCRIMRSSYQGKYHEHAHAVDVTELYNEGEIVSVGDSDHDYKETHINKILGFMKGKLNDDAMLILEIELSPPPFVLDQLRDLGKKDHQRIPNDVIADYLGYGNSNNVINYIKDLRSDIRYTINLAKKFFTESPTPQLVN